MSGGLAADVVIARPLARCLETDLVLAVCATVSRSRGVVEGVFMSASAVCGKVVGVLQGGAIALWDHGAT